VSSTRNGHYCYVCGRDRPNEKFSGRGHKRHICKDCVRKRDKDDGIHDADLWEAYRTVDEETVERLIADYDDTLQLALMLVSVCASHDSEMDGTLRCTRTYVSEIFEWLDAEGLATHSMTGKSVALTELGYRVAEELLRRHGFAEEA